MLFFSLPPAVVCQVEIAQSDSLSVIKLTVQDGLALEESVHPASYQLTIFVEVPTALLNKGELRLEHLEKVWANLYGADWRNGNGDGSAYVIISLEMETLGSQEALAGDWKSTPKAWFYRVLEDGQVRSLEDEAR